MSRAAVGPLRWARVGVLTCVVAGAMAGAAAAARPATDAERQAAAAAVGLPPECASVRVSEIDASWMALTDTNSSGCPMADGVVVLHSRGGTVSEVTAGSDFGYCPVKGVPDAIAAEFSLCRRVIETKYTYVYDFAREALVHKPRRLPQGAHGVYAKLSWSQWKREEAHGKGTFLYADAYEQFRVPVKIRLYRARMCENGVWLFTRRKVTAVHSADKRKIAFDANHTAYGSCSENAFAPRRP